MASGCEATLPCSFCGREPREIILMMEATRGEPRICNECLYQGMTLLARSDEIDFDALVAAAKRDDGWQDVGPERAAKGCWRSRRDSNPR